MTNLVLVKDEGLNNCTSWIFKLSTILVQWQRPYIPLKSAPQPWQGLSNRMTRQFRIHFYFWTLVMVRKWSFMKHSKIPASFPLHLFAARTAKMICILQIRWQWILWDIILFLSTFYPITGNALTILHPKRLWWIKIVSWFYIVRTKAKRATLRKQVAPLCKLGKYSYRNVLQKWFYLCF